MKPTATALRPLAIAACNSARENVINYGLWAPGQPVPMESIQMNDNSAARNPVFDRITKSQAAAFGMSTPYHSLELPGGHVIPGIIPIEQLRTRLHSYPIPTRLDGKRVLDVGAASGWNSFELERRGATVVAIDCVEYEEFTVAKRLLNSHVDYRILDVDELSPELLGTFDYVLFLGVFYHLRHPLLALEKICALTRDIALVESFVTDTTPLPGRCSMEFYETDDLGGQIDNWYGPTTHCLAAMCRSAGFVRAEVLYNHDRRAGVACYRKRLIEPTDAKPPLLAVAMNNRHENCYFSSNKDEYICIHFYYFASVCRDDVYVQIDELGVPVLVLAATDADRWQVNVRVPPGLTPGAHSVAISVHGSPLSNHVKIVLLDVGQEPPRDAITLPSPVSQINVPAPQLVALENTLDRGTVFRRYRAERMRCIFEADCEALDTSSVELRIDGNPHALLVVARGTGNRWEINLKLEKNLGAGRHSLRLRTAGSTFSNALPFDIVPTNHWVGSRFETG